MTEKEIRKAIVTDFLENHMMNWIYHRVMEAYRVKPIHRTMFIKLAHHIKKSGQTYHLIIKKSRETKSAPVVLMAEVTSDKNKKYYLPIPAMVSKSDILEWAENPYREKYYSSHAANRLYERGGFGEGDPLSALVDYIGSDSVKTLIYSDPDNNRIVMASKSGIFLGKMIQDVISCETFVSCNLLKTTQLQSYEKLQGFFEAAAKAVSDSKVKNAVMPDISELNKFKLDIKGAMKIYAEFYEEREDS